MRDRLRLGLGLGLAPLCWTWTWTWTWRQRTWTWTWLCWTCYKSAKVPQNPHLGGLNRHFNPNMRKIQMAISSDPCIRLTWNLTGRCGQQQTSWVVSYGGNTIPRWRTAAILKIDISPIQWKIIRFSWNFVHSSRFWTGWTSRDQKWKRCIGQTPSLTERISFFIANVL